VTLLLLAQVGEEAGQLLLSLGPHLVFQLFVATDAFVFNGHRQGKQIFYHRNAAEIIKA
jgi:hypothetical protein